MKSKSVRSSELNLGLNLRLNLGLLFGLYVGLSFTLLFATPLFAGESSPMTPDGVVSVKSKFKVPHTVDRLKSIVTKKGMKVIAHVNHAKAAKSADIDLPPTELVIFGNPKIGSPMMECARSIAIDLPQKMLVWQDRAGQVWLSYNDPVYIANRHKLGDHCRDSLKKVAGALSKFSKAAGGME